MSQASTATNTRRLPEKLNIPGPISHRLKNFSRKRGLRPVAHQHVDPTPTSTTSFSDCPIPPLRALPANADLPALELQSARHA